MRYLGSTKNLAGCALGLLGVLLRLVGVLGPYWPVVVVALYAAGALLAPPERVRLLPLSSSQEISQLRADLATLLAQANAHANRLPPTALDTIRNVIEILDGLLDRPGDLTADPEVLHNVIRLARQDLPTSIQSHLNVPRWLASRDQLLTQLALLEKEAHRIAEAFYHKDIQQQTDHTTYLRERDLD
ncbi:hypothetical protein [Actinocrispum wychmicini]|uniref:Uncharacterized protein n=1 Tax=Actinocrispum wychmicini TaxID=1213861 RepID=A0A4R2J9Q2_9PSEU|nr:hypothetical protein [Actinocrispum wychmicini]TCO54977.1 hypothetical protein EV192_108265 [Actinocrispum wychmicini]